MLFRSEGAWILTQFSRWGWNFFPSNRVELLSQVYRNDLCNRALELAGFAALRPYVRVTTYFQWPWSARRRMLAARGFEGAL